MMQRCYEPNCKDYARYHGKGIVVCWRIRSDSKQLVELIGKRPAQMTLDRKDNRANYSCGDCPECAANGWTANIQWADRTRQSRNQDRIRLIEINGRSACIGEWAQITGIHYMTLMTRYKHGVRGEALIAAPGPTGKRYK